MTKYRLKSLAPVNESPVPIHCPPAPLPEALIMVFFAEAILEKNSGFPRMLTSTVTGKMLFGGPPPGNPVSGACKLSRSALPN